MSTHNVEAIVKPPETIYNKSNWQETMFKQWNPWVVWMSFYIENISKQAVIWLLIKESC